MDRRSRNYAIRIRKIEEKELPDGATDADGRSDLEARIFDVGSVCDLQMRSQSTTACLHAHVVWCGWEGGSPRSSFELGRKTF